MGANGGSGDGGEGRPDLSMSAVNERLRQFIISHREAEARGEHRPFAESDALLAAMAEEALAKQAEGERLKAEAEARLERLELDRRGGRLQ
jgi:hypothetical protein